MRETKYWFINFIAGLVVLVLLGLHMGIMHLDSLLAMLAPLPAKPLEWVNMLDRGKSTFFTATYVLLLASALFHGLYGVRTMITEYLPGKRAHRVIVTICWAVGVALFSVGTYATVIFHMSSSVN